MWATQSEGAYKKHVNKQVRDSWDARVAAKKAANQTSPSPVMTGEMKVTEETEEFQVLNLPEKKKEHKPFLDFRKKKKKEE